MPEEESLPPKEELKMAESNTIMVITIVCPHCKHKWEVVDSNLNDCTKPDPVDIIEPCPECGKWMKLYEDDTAIDMFYEDYEDD